MSGSTTLSIVLNIFQNLVHALAFIGCAVAAYLTLQQPRVKGWLEDSGFLVRIVFFIALTELLVLPVNSIIGSLFALPNGLVNQYNNGFIASMQCLAGLLMIASLAVGGWMLARRQG
jgi:hypothetical protein